MDDYFTLIFLSYKYAQVQTCFVPPNLVFCLDLTVGQANLTVKMGCSHCEQCWEVERSVGMVFKVGVVSIISAN